MKFNPAAYSQYQIGFLCENEAELSSRDKCFDKTTIVGHAEDTNFLIVTFPIKLAHLMMATEMVSSKSDFVRKLKEGAIRVGVDWVDEQQVKTDVEFARDCREISVRLGKRFLEFLNASVLQSEAGMA